MSEEWNSELFNAEIECIIEEINQSLHEEGHDPLNLSDKLFVGILMDHLLDTGRVTIKKPEPIEFHEDEDNSGL